MARPARPRPLACLALALASLASLAATGCGHVTACTEIGCDSTMVVDYGNVVVNEPYLLTLDMGQKQVFECLSDDPDAEPLPEWLTCDAGGFEITGERAEATTISIAVVPLSTEEAVIPNALVTLTVEQVLEPNGPDCEPVCYRRVGQVPPNGGLP